MAVTPIYGIPYVESADLVANYPGVSEFLAEKVEDKLPTYAATAPASPSVGQVWIDSTGTPIGKVWNGSAWKIFSGAGDANFTNAATGTYTDGEGISYKYITFTGSGELIVDRAGLADVLVVGGGGGCARSNNSQQCGGGAGSVLSLTGLLLPLGTLTITVGGSGAGLFNATNPTASNGTSASIGTLVVSGPGGGGLTTDFTPISFTGYPSGGGAGGRAVLGSGFVLGGGSLGTGETGTVSNITNVSITYGTAKSSGAGLANTGDGGGASNASGGSGVVILRVRTN